VRGTGGCVDREGVGVGLPTEEASSCPSPSSADSRASDWALINSCRPRSRFLAARWTGRKGSSWCTNETLRGAARRVLLEGLPRDVEDREGGDVGFSVILFELLLELEGRE
jgi:hypothetical protein